FHRASRRGTHQQLRGTGPTHCRAIAQNHLWQSQCPGRGGHGPPPHRHPNLQNAGSQRIGVSHRSHHPLSPPSACSFPAPSAEVAHVNCYGSSSCNSFASVRPEIKTCTSSWITTPRTKIPPCRSGWPSSLAFTFTSPPPVLLGSTWWSGSFEI